MSASTDYKPLLIARGVGRTYHTIRQKNTCCDLGNTELNVRLKEHVYFILAITMCGLDDVLLMILLYLSHCLPDLLLFY